MVDLHQPDTTHRCAVAHARLDRIYLNQHIVEQVDRELQVVALDWFDLSHHRAVLAARKIPDKLEHTHRVIPKQVYTHPDTRRCQLAFQQRVDNDFQ